MYTFHGTVNEIDIITYLANLKYKTSQNKVVFL